MEKMAYSIRISMCPLDNGGLELNPAGWKWRGSIGLEVIDPLFTLAGSDVRDMMSRLVLMDQKCRLSPTFPEDDEKDLKMQKSFSSTSSR
ncbi:hypothetical protein RIF29_09088 [Crotalaria pallida]|uniref:Uncharacterized protein n=1 Tax=Crotalaria pallida TaxID=3830 RepID=A0AAN9FXR4_CROPI